MVSIQKFSDVTVVGMNTVEKKNSCLLYLSISIKDGVKILFSDVEHARGS